MFIQNEPFQLPLYTNELIFDDFKDIDYYESC